MDLHDAVVLVTGASSGIGAELSRQLLAEKGARVVMAARRKERLDILAEEFCGVAVPVPTDVGDPAQCRRAVGLAVQRFGRLDVLVNNAACAYFGTIENMSAEDLETLFRTNVLGVMRMTQAALPALKESRGMVVNVTSGLGRRALPFLSQYGGTKAMLNRLTEAMRLELKPYGIRVIDYGPPETETELSSASRGGEFGDAPQGGRRRKAEPADVARRMVRAIEREKRSTYEGGSLAIMNALAPRMVDAMFYKGMVLRFMGQAGSKFDAPHTPPAEDGRESCD